MKAMLLLAELSTRLRSDLVIASSITFLLFASFGLMVIAHPPLDGDLPSIRQTNFRQQRARPGAAGPIAVIVGLLCGLALLLASGF
jgi:hypothetical protein